MQDFVGIVIQKKNLTSSVVELSVRVTDPGFTYVPGQFVQFRIGQASRAYSISSWPEEEVGVLSFVIGLVEDGVGSNFMRGLRAGEQVTVSQAAGRFTAQDVHGPVCLIANGVGVAPLRGIIGGLLQHGFTSPITLMCGYHDQGDILYPDFFDGLDELYLNFDVEYCLSQPKTGWKGFTGRVTKNLYNNLEKFAHHTFFICGSKDMVADSRSILLKAKTPMAAIRLEIF